MPIQMTARLAPGARFVLVATSELSTAGGDVGAAAGDAAARPAEGLSPPQRSAVARRDRRASRAAERTPRK
jgi:hypothetical protein